MARFEGQTFKDVKVVLDGNTYAECVFEACLMVFSGAKPVKLIRCTFGKDVSWSFAGAAALTLDFMAALYHGAGPGARVMIEGVFDQVRKGASLHKVKGKEIN